MCESKRKKNFLPKPAMSSLAKFFTKAYLDFLLQMVTFKMRYVTQRKKGKLWREMKCSRARLCLLGPGQVKSGCKSDLIKEFLIVRAQHLYKGGGMNRV